ncbi:MAG: oligosaccharide flippase family protein [Solirubrobacteraceae bacterium]
MATIFVARLLGGDGTGSFALALSVIAVQTVIGSLGFLRGGAYFVRSGRWAPRDAFSVSQWAALALGMAGAALAILVRLVLPAPFGDLTVTQTALAALALPASLSWFFGSYVALADDHFEGFVIPPALQSGSAMVLVLVLGLEFGLTGTIVALLASQICAAALTFWFGYRRLGRVAHRPDPLSPGDQLRRAIRFGLKGYASNALQILNYRVDVLLLASVATSAAVGSYAVAIGVTTTLWLLPQAVSDVVFPRVASLSAEQSNDADRQRAFVETKSLRHVVLVVLLGAVVLAGAMVLLIVPIYGSDFEDAVELGLIRLPGVMLLGLAGVMSATFVGRGRPEYSLYIALMVTPCTMIFYAILIPTFGATGAAAASSLSFALSFMLSLHFYRRTIGEPIGHRLVPTRSEIRDYVALLPQIRARLRRGAPR